MTGSSPMHAAQEFVIVGYTPSKTSGGSGLACRWLSRREIPQARGARRDRIYRALRRRFKPGLTLKVRVRVRSAPAKEKASLGPARSCPEVEFRAWTAGQPATRRLSRLARGQSRHYYVLFVVAQKPTGKSMIRKRHPSAPTDTATRREIQQREESTVLLSPARRDQRTITKVRRRA